MCWSGEASAVLATVGLATMAYAAYKKEPAPIWIALAYFSLMELLQAFTYSVIDECSLPSNQVATLLGYLHITFQPFFVNMLFMHFIPKGVRQRICHFVYGLCFVSATIMILQLYPFAWAGQCSPLQPMCAEDLCSVSGNWHIAWNVPINGIGAGLDTQVLLGRGLPYMLVAVYLPLLYGSWRMNAYHFIMGPMLAWALTDNVNEWPAVWCLLSIGLLLLVLKTPLRDIMYVKSWFLWPKSWLKEKPEGQVTGS